jgi:hypothetical protein
VELQTELERVPGRARFVIQTSDVVGQDRLEHLGYTREGTDRFATMWFADSPAVPGSFGRFSNSIEQMVLQSARLVPVPWDQALTTFLRRADGSGLRWWIYGSAALAVRGLPVAPGDVDINVSDAYRAAEIFDGLLVTPVTEMEGAFATRFCRAFDGAIFEWISDPRRELDDPSRPHEQGPLIADRIETVTWRGRSVHVPPLSAQLAVSELRGLKERAEVIRAALRDDPRHPGGS